MGDILIVDDEEDIRTLISDILGDEGFDTRLAASSEEAMAELNRDPPGLMILDIWLKDSRMDGIDILKATKRDNPDIPIIIISGHGNIEIAVAAIKQGAYDFIEKPFNIDQLLVVISRAMETSRLRRENSELRRKELRSASIIGSSSACKALRSQLDKVTKSNGRVMLTGPSGSGKEIAARYIHANSDRANGPFVSVSSASIEPDRMEEVLFGRESTERGIEQGLLEEAHGGVVFFGEVADMPSGTQSKILRVLTEQQFQRVGGTDKVRVDLRVISSTTRNLEAEVEAGNFREELFHRLNVVPITVPGLSDRSDDIPELARYFIASFNKSQGLPLRELADDAVAMLQSMKWPGNVRQLKNTIEKVLILGADKGDITATEVEGESRAKEKDSGKAALSGDFTNMPLRQAREIFEREYLNTQLSRFGGNISRAAKFVGMERSALHRKLKSLNVMASSRNAATEGTVANDMDEAI